MTTVTVRVPAELFLTVEVDENGARITYSSVLAKCGDPLAAFTGEHDPTVWEVTNLPEDAHETEESLAGDAALAHVRENDWPAPAIEG